MQARWAVIISGLMFGLFGLPLLYLSGSCLAILLAYALCKRLDWPKSQLFLEYLYGGLVTGGMLQVLVYFGITNQIVPLIIAPCLVWLFTRSVFLYVEGRYSLIPVNVEKLKLSPVPTDYPLTGAGVSAWSGEASGGSTLPDDAGARILWDFTCTGELCMGGPTYGEVVFSNHCAFSGVGPSVVMSDDGRYAAMTLPSRNAWGLMIADLQNKRVFEPQCTDMFWEIDSIKNNRIYGRVSPLTSNAKSSIGIGQALANAQELPMVNDDGWWVVDYENRQAFPQYPAVTCWDSENRHRVVFVPDLKPFKQNPFKRYKHPTYSVLVDDFMLDFTVNFPAAVWVNGAKSQELGRFLVIAGKIIDFWNPLTHAFDLKQAIAVTLPTWNDTTHLSWADFADGGNGRLIVQGMVCPRSVSLNGSEIWVTGATHPWDDEDVEYWDLALKKRRQTRTRIQRYLRYQIDLDRFMHNQALALSAEIDLPNRAKPQHTAKLTGADTCYDKAVSYAGYHCLTSCAVDPGIITEEAVWSHCGRYLAVLAYAPKPDVPNKISIIDFETATMRELDGRYALPSFIWFDKGQLEFSHLVGIVESITSYPGNNKQNEIRVDHPEHKGRLFDLLIGSIPERRLAAEKAAAKKSKNNSYCHGSVHLIGQHCSLFAPDFKHPVLQPPVANE